MAYTKNTWVDQEGQVKYSETVDGDYKIFTPNFEDVTEIGTPVNAVNMNHIENGIEYCDTNMVKRASTSSATGNTTTPVYIKDNGVVEVCSREIPDVSGLNSTKTVSLTGAVTGSNTINLSSSNSISIETTGKSKTVSLSGAVSGSATLNTGNTNTVSIYTTLSKLSSSNFNSSGISSMFKAMTANFNAGVSMAVNETHTATSDGYINWVCSEVSTTRDLKINNIIVASVRAGGEGDDCKTAALLPIAKGSTYWCNKGTLTFYPLNGV